MKKTAEEMMIFSASRADAVALARSWGKETMTVMANGVSIIVSE